jgi:hypothetical protein
MKFTSLFILLFYTTNLIAEDNWQIMYEYATSKPKNCLGEYVISNAKPSSPKMKFEDPETERDLNSSKITVFADNSILYRGKYFVMDPNGPKFCPGDCVKFRPNNIGRIKFAKIQYTRRLGFLDRPTKDVNAETFLAVYTGDEKEYGKFVDKFGVYPKNIIQKLDPKACNHIRHFQITPEGLKE